MLLLCVNFTHRKKKGSKDLWKLSRTDVYVTVQKQRITGHNISIQKQRITEHNISIQKQSKLTNKEEK